MTGRKVKTHKTELQVGCFPPPLAIPHTQVQETKQGIRRCLHGYSPGCGYSRLLQHLDCTCGRQLLFDRCADGAPEEQRDSGFFGVQKLENYPTRGPM